MRIFMGSFFLVEHAEGISRYIEKLQFLLQEKGIKCYFSAPKYRSYSRTIYLRSYASLCHHLWKSETKFDMVHLHFPILPSIIPFKRRLRNVKKLVMQLWNHPYIEHDVFDLWHLLFNSRALSSVALKELNSPLVVSSQHLKRTLEDLGGSNVKFIPAGIDVEKFSFSPKSIDKNSGESVSLLYYGHLTKWKGVENLVKAMPTITKEEPAARLKVIWTGYGGSYGKIINLVRRLDLQNHVIVERGIHNDIPFLLSQCDIGILPLLSPVATASPPRTLLEMMSAGLPVVTTKTSGASEIITDKKTGILTGCSPESIAEGVLSLISNKSLAKKTCFAARKYIVENHDWRKIIPLYVELYEENL